MPGELNGFTASSADHLLLGPGAAYANVDEPGFLGAVDAAAAYTALLTGAIKLGATRGGLEFMVEPEMRDIEIDGKRGMTKGYRRITAMNASITVNFAELSLANLALMLPATITTDEGNGYTSVTTKSALADADYIDNIAIVAVKNGGSLLTPEILLIRNALATGSQNISLQDDDEAIPSITFEAHYIPGDDTPPHTHYVLTPA